VAFPQGYEEYLRTRSGKFRRGINQIRRNAASAGLVVGELFPDDVPPEDLPDLFLALHLERLGTRSVFSPGSPKDAFVRAVFPRLFAGRRLRAFGIRLRGEVIAIDILMCAPDALCLWNGGYREEAARFSPGRLLLDAEIRAAEAEGYREHDLSRGDQDWKRRWANLNLEVGRLEFECGD
jgi:CelD/BcsL family acetyltransferase involved in cellulose biosynthesis